MPSGEPLAVADSNAQALRKLVGPALHRWQSAEALARDDRDPEGVHELRVATRRLRSGLQVFGAGKFAPVAKGLRQELRWLARQLGSLRDIDVQLARLPDLLQKALPKGGLDTVRDALLQRRGVALIQVRAALDSVRYRRLVAQLEAIASGKTEASAGAARKRARGSVRKQYRRLRKSIQASGDDRAGLHRARVRVKQLRYLLEIVAPISGRPGVQLLRELIDAQKQLGRFHDAAVSLEWAHEWRRLGRLSGAAWTKIEMTLAADAKRSTRRARKAARRLCSRATRTRVDAVLARLEPTKGEE